MMLTCFVGRIRKTAAIIIIYRSLINLIEATRSLYCVLCIVYCLCIAVVDVVSQPATELLYFRCLESGELAEAGQLLQ
jgi:hypothetical protein